jgi:hypothetical protein
MLGCNLGRRKPPPGQRAGGERWESQRTNNKIDRADQAAHTVTEMDGRMGARRRASRGPARANRRFSSPSTNMLFPGFTSERS